MSRSLRLAPWSNGYLHIPDPADRIRNCPGCGEDYDPERTHRCSHEERGDER